MSNQKKPSMLNPYGWPDGPLPPAPSIPYQPWPVKIELLNEVPRYLLVVERIMEKALEHKKAGRTDSFRQVLVPMDDYQALKKYFDVDGLHEEVLVATAIGILSVHPVNPDGATFVD